MSEVSIEQYLGPYQGSADATPEVIESAIILLSKVNEVYALAIADGVDLPINPATKCGVSGTGNGGFRPGNSKVGAKHSTHKTGHGIDRYDPLRAFASWCLRNLEELKCRGLHMEDPRWTPTWVHLQDQAPKSGRTVYVPSEAPPLAPALPGQ